jgi:hypothetical protein
MVPALVVWLDYTKLAQSLKHFPTVLAGKGGISVLRVRGCANPVVIVVHSSSAS